MAKIISSLPGSTSVLSRTSQLINDGSDNTSTYVETDELGAIAFSNDYNDLDNLPIISDGVTNLSYDASPTQGTVLSDTGNDAVIPLADTINAGLLSPTDKTKLNNTSGVNSGNQTTIVGITGTKAQFNTSVTDGDFLFVGDITQYTDEQAQDAIGNILTDSTTIDFSYNEAPNTISAEVKPNSITTVELADDYQLNLGFTPENVANKQNSLAIDGTGTKYPTVDAVNAGTTYKRTIAQIRALTGTLPNTNFYTTDLGQEGNWYYDSDDSTSLDNNATVLVTSDGKRIKRIFDNGVSINWFGAKTTNTATQNTTAFDLAITWVIGNNGGKIRVPSGKYSVNPIHIPAISISTGRIIPIEITGEYMPSQLFGTIGSYPLNYSGSVIECLSTTTGESVIVVNPHPSDYGGFSGVKPIIKNLDIRTYNNSQIGGLNLRYAHQAVVENCQITNGIWSVDSSLPTYPNAVGLHTPDLDNAALTILKNVSISGFYTGIVVNEHIDGSSLNLTCNLIAMDFKNANHSSSFAMVDMQRNTVGIKFSGNHAVNIDNLNLEHAGDTQTNPNNIWQLTTYDIDDILNKGKGLINWHSVLGASGNTPNDIRLNGGNNIKYINLHENKIEVNSGDFNGEYKYNSDISTPNSRAWKTKNDSSIAGSWSLQVANDLPESSWTDVITATKEGRVDFNKSFSVSENVTASLAVTSFSLKNNNGTTFGESASFFQTNNFAYLNIEPNQTNIYAYRAGGLRLATGNSRIVFANGNADLDASTEKIGIEATGVVKIANLSGIGTRLVYSDDYGNLSAPDVPTAPTAPVGTNTPQIATMEALQAASALKASLGANVSFNSVNTPDASLSGGNVVLGSHGTGLLYLAGGGEYFRNTRPAYAGWESNVQLNATSFVATAGTIRLKNYTVTTLPSGTQGDTAYVTDALSPAYLTTVVGGGTVVCPVFYNGSAWVAH